MSEGTVREDSGKRREELSTETPGHGNFLNIGIYIY